MRTGLPAVLGLFLILLGDASWAQPALAREKNCLACHDLERRLAAPAFRAISFKYLDDRRAQEKLTRKIRAGGSGVWGRDQMPPNPSLTPDDAAALAKWILSIR